LDISIGPSNLFTQNISQQALQKSVSDSKFPAAIRVESVSDARQSGSLEEISLTASAYVSSIETKRKRQLEKIRLVINEKTDDFQKKQLMTETLIRDLEVLSEIMIERQAAFDEYFSTRLPTGDKVKAILEEFEKQEEEEKEKEKEQSKKEKEEEKEEEK